MDVPDSRLALLSDMHEDAGSNPGRRQRWNL